MLALVILRNVSSGHTLQPCPPLVAIVECYSHKRLLLQRDVLALRSGEAKARYNIIQAVSKIVLWEAWLTKRLYNEL